MNSSKRPRWLPSPAMGVALLALVLALGGTATALSGKFSVKRNDIAPKAVSNSKIAGKAVTSGKIRDKSIGSYKLRLNGISHVPGESSTTSQVPVDLGGPNASVKVPSGAMVAIHARAAMRSTGSNTARVYLYEPTMIPKPVKILASGATPNFQTRYSTSGTSSSGADDGVVNVARGGWIVMPATPGVKTFSLRYDTSGGTAIFKDRQLTVTVIR
jgi:hypothetical protein